MVIHLAPVIRLERPLHDDASSSTRACVCVRVCADRAELLHNTYTPTPLVYLLLRHKPRTRVFRAVLRVDVSDERWANKETFTQTRGFFPLQYFYRT